jgi:hypothetical protein
MAEERPGERAPDDPGDDEAVKGLTLRPGVG